MRMKSLFVFALSLSFSLLYAFQTPDMVEIKIFPDMNITLADSLESQYIITEAGNGWVNIDLPVDEFLSIEKDIPVYEIVSRSMDGGKHRGSDENGTDFFHDYNSMVSAMEAIAADYPEIVRLDTLGWSVEGRMILGAKITDNPDIEENEPEFRVLGLHHGDEFMAEEIPLELLEHLASGYGNDPMVTNLVNTIETWIVPMVNPDGRMATPYATRYNANGEDLNRDYGYMWDGLTPEPFSQPETRAIRENGIENLFCLSLSFHTSGDIVNSIWNHKSGRPDDWDIVEPLSNEYASYNGYWAVEGYDWYQVFGDTNDWSYGSRSDLDWTIEVSDYGIETVWNENRDAMLALMQHATDGVHGIVTDIDTGLPLEGMVCVNGVRQPWYTDPRVGDYHRLLLPGTYDLTFSAV